MRERISRFRKIGLGLYGRCNHGGYIAEFQMKLVIELGDPGRRRLLDGDGLMAAAARFFRRQ
jgi:hypothetical protein